MSLALICLALDSIGPLSGVSLGVNRRIFRRIRSIRTVDTLYTVCTLHPTTLPVARHNHEVLRLPPQVYILQGRYSDLDKLSVEHS